jgi:hypothetical protein
MHVAYNAQICTLPYHVYHILSGMIKAMLRKFIGDVKGEVDVDAEGPRPLVAQHGRCCGGAQTL